MAETRIKLCGLNTAAAVDAAVTARAECIGFNFYPPSPRAVTVRDLAALGARAAGKTLRVGVFVDPDDALLADTVATGALDAIQLHGREPPERAAQLRARFGLPVWKVLAVAAPADVARAAQYTGAADFLLFDAKTPGGKLPGGMGLAFDWDLLRGHRHALPWGLAGGLDAANVGAAIAATGAPLVDTASGIESAPGIKDEARIAAFCRAVRAA